MTDPLLNQLAAILGRIDPVPERLVADARAALGLGLIPDGCQVLEPVAGERVLVRSGSRSFRFEDNEISLDVELRRLPWRLSLIGLIAPVEDLRVCHLKGSVHLSPDGAGCFRVDDLPRGPVRIVVGESRATRWFWP